MHFIPSNFTKESSLRGAEYITIPADCTRNWHLTNLHPRASKGNKIMRKLQGEWVLVPHGELKLIICDNLSASENSNMSTKLCEPLREAGKKRMIKEKGKGKRKGQLETSVAAEETRLPVGCAVNVLDDCDLRSLISMYSLVLHLFWSLFEWHVERFDPSGDRSRQRGNTEPNILPFLNSSASAAIKRQANDN